MSEIANETLHQMPLTIAQASQLEETINRLATESILAQSGRDDGLVPSYSLLGDLRDACFSEPTLKAPITAAHAALDKLLDTAAPFDHATIQQLRTLVEWLPVAMDNLKNNRPVPPCGAAAVAVAPIVESEKISTTDEESTADILLDLHLEENKELLGEFYAEAVDHLQQIEAALLALDQQPDNPEALNSIFRSFHTIKGNAGFLGLVPMQMLAHEVESLLDLARNHKLNLTAVIITEILKSRDALAAFTQQVARALEQGFIPDQVIPISQLLSAVKRLAVADGGASKYSLRAPSTPAASANPVPPAANFFLPPANPTLPTTISAPAEIASVFPISLPMAPSAPRPNPSSNAIEAAATGKSGVGNQTVRVNTEKLDSLMDVVGRARHRPKSTY